MASGRTFEFDLKAEIGRLFDDASVAVAQPNVVILMAPLATGKTMFRKQRYSSGYVLIDAGEIFLNLSRGEFLPFPGQLEAPMEVVGRAVTDRALSERRHIVTEIIGADQSVVDQLITSLQNIDYQVEVAQLTCPPEVAIERNRNRNPADSISAYYSEPFHSRWIIETCRRIAR